MLRQIHISLLSSIMLFRSGKQLMSTSSSLNERLVDFEGDRESCLGAEPEGERLQLKLILMTRKDMIHLFCTPRIAF
jgi:hypothetical protein